MKQSCRNILKRVYDKFQKDADSLYIPMDEDDFTPETAKFENDINALLAENYIREDAPLSSGYILSLTEKGSNYVENGFQANPSLPQANFNFQNANIGNQIIGNNAIIGDNASGNEFNASETFTELHSLIEKKPDFDQPALQELLRALEKIKESSEPVRPGILAKFSDLVKKHTDLIVPIGKILVDIFIAPK